MSVYLQNRTDLTDSDLDFLDNLTDVDWLSLHGCTNITSKGMRHLQHLVELRYLSLACTSVDGASLGFLQNFPHLEILDLEQVRNIVGAVQFIANLKSLRHLDLSQTEIDSTSVRFILDNTRVTSVHLTNCKISADDVLRWDKIEGEDCEEDSPPQNLNWRMVSFQLSGDPVHHECIVF